MVVKNCSGLIGDNMSGIPITLYWARHSDEHVYAWFWNREVASLVPKIRNLTLISEDEANERQAKGEQTKIVDVGQVFTPYSHNYHMTQAHFLYHGLPDPGGPVRHTIEYDVSDDTPEYDFLISPHSYSNSADNNKFWAFNNWEEIIAYLNKYKIGILGGKDDPYFTSAPNVDYIYGKPLREVAGIISKVRGKVLSVDNGMSHLTFAVGSPHVLLYPEVLQPPWVDNPFAKKIYGKPCNITVAQVIAKINEK